MRKRSIIISSVLALLAAVPAQATSIFEKIGGGVKKTATKIYETSGPPDFIVVLVTILNYLLTFVGVLFFLLLIYSGYLWMTARGKEEQIDKAKRITREAVIGLILMITARLLTEFILSQIGTATA